MFDVSFTELMVIGLVALIVIGPERLPRVARTAGHLMGRLQRYVSTVKADISREMHIEDLKRFEQSVKQEMSTVSSAVTHEISEIESAARIEPPIEPPIDPPPSVEAAPPLADRSDAVPAPGGASTAVPPPL